MFSCLFCSSIYGADIQADVSFGAENGFAQAEKELNQASQEFQKEADQISKGLQQNGETSWSQASTAVPGQTPASPPADPRANALQGSPQTGYAGTWTDPATGDVITSVIAPTAPPVQNSQNYPIIVEPQINGNYGQSGQNSATGWTQWPTSPDNPGYPPQSVPYNQPPPPGWHPYYPGQPYPGFNPYPYPYPQPYPGYENGSFTPPAYVPGIPGSSFPPINPNYRPLRPTPPPPSTTGGIWQPGMIPPGQPGSVPPTGSMTTPGHTQPIPSMPSMPLAPAGQSWHSSPFAPRPQGGMFGSPGNIRRGTN